MLELLRTVRVVGLERMLKLRKAQRLSWHEILNGFYLTRIIQTLLNVGFFDELETRGSVEVGPFAAAADLDPSILQSLCDLLYSFQILDNGGPGYVLSARGRLIAEVGKGWFNGVYGYEGVFHDLESLLRKQKKYGEDLVRDPYFVARGSGEIESWLYFPLAIDFIARGKYKKALDLGCGEGRFLRDLCRKAPGVRGCGIDLSPEALEDGRRQAAAAGLGDRIDLFAGDVTRLRALPAALQGVDVATTFFVLHEVLSLGEDALVEFLRGFRDLFPGVPLMAFEVDKPTPSQMRSNWGQAPAYFLQHELSRQSPLPKERWPPYFEAAGFRTIEQRNLEFARSVIFVVR